MSGTVAILLAAGLLIFLLAELLGHPWKGLLAAVLFFVAAAALGIYEEEERFRKSTLSQSAASCPSNEGFSFCLTRPPRGVFHALWRMWRPLFPREETMIGTPLTAKDWNHELETTHGDSIVRMLMPYHEIPMLLDAPMPHLDKEVPAALLGLGLPAASCRTVSRQAFMQAVDALPEHARRGGGMGLLVGLSESLSQPTEPLLERNAERTPSFGAAANLLQASLLGTLTERMDRDFGRLSNTGVRLALRQSLTHAVAALADGRPDLALKSEPFVRMFRAGNWPLGIMKDGDFLVLVR